MKITLILLLIGTALFSSCAWNSSKTNKTNSLNNVETQNVIRSETCVEYMTLDETITGSDNIILADNLGKSVIDGRIYYNFKVKTEYKGRVDSEYITVIEDDTTYSCISNELTYNAGDGYQEGHEYIVMLGHDNNVYEDMYYFSNQLIIESEDNKLTGIMILGESVETNFKTIDDMANHIRDVIGENPSPEKEQIKYIVSDDINEIANFSDCIVKVKINGIITNNESNRDLYECDVIETFKGETSSSIRPILFKNSVEIGKEYYLFLIDTGNFYTLASKNSVYNIDEIDISKYI